MARIYRVPATVLVYTQGHLLEAARRGVEGVVLWTGTTNGCVRRCVVPPQCASSTLVTVDPVSAAQVVFECADGGEVILVQVHSHLGAAFHSTIDNTGAVWRDVGFWSIVVANGGKGFLGTRQSFRVFEHLGNQVWREVAGDELDARLRIQRPDV